MLFVIFIHSLIYYLIYGLLTFLFLAPRGHFQISFRSYQYPWTQHLTSYIFVKKKEKKRKEKKIVYEHINTKFIHQNVAPFLQEYGGYVGDYALGDSVVFHVHESSIEDIFLFSRCLFYSSCRYHSHFIPTSSLRVYNKSEKYITCISTYSNGGSETI